MASLAQEASQVSPKLTHPDPKRLGVLILLWHDTAQCEHKKCTHKASRSIDAWGSYVTAAPYPLLLPQHNPFGPPSSAPGKLPHHPVRGRVLRHHGRDYLAELVLLEAEAQRRRCRLGRLARSTTAKETSRPSCPPQVQRWQKPFASLAARLTILSGFGWK